MKTLTVVIFLTFTYASLMGQQQNSISERISQVGAPGSPSSVILGISPSAIERPKSFEALEASIFSNFSSTSSGNVVPDDLSIEFTPYWAVRNVSINESEYLTPNIGQSLLQNLSISLTSTQDVYKQIDSLNTNALGIGLRTMLLSGSKNMESKILKKFNKIREVTKISNQISSAAEDMNCEQCTKDEYMNKLLQKLNDDSNLPSELIEFYINRIREEFENYNPNDMDANSDSIDNVFDEHFLNGLLDDLSFLRSDYKGFKLELALASGLFFPQNDLDSIVAPSFSFWLTPSFTPFKSDKFTFLGVFRYSHYDYDYFKSINLQDPIIESAIDYGGRIVFNVNSFSVELEAVGRNSDLIVSREIDDAGNTVTTSRGASDFQWIFNLNYSINPQIILSYSIGRQFDNIILNNGKPFISLATLNFGFGGPTKE